MGVADALHAEAQDVGLGFDGAVEVGQGLEVAVGLGGEVELALDIPGHPGLSHCGQHH
jgi:hypothetical protein